MSIYSDRLLLATKLAIPQTSLKRVVPRLRLNSKLDAGKYVPLTLISAPAGFGKTMLIGTWIQQRESKAAWVTLESKDDELVRFWRYVIAALKRLHPVIGEQIEVWLQELQPPNVEEMLTVLINALVALPHDVLLVLDNYQVITAPSIHHSLGFLLEHVPPHFHLIIATRVDPPLPLARFRVQGELVELRAADLRFTEDEATAFLLQSTGISLPAKDIAELNRSTEGWAAGLQLAALSLQGRDDQAGISKFINTFTGTNRHVLNYLTEEVLIRLPEDVQAFLLSTSILEQLNASLCDMLTQQSNGRAMLEWLGQADLFLIALDDQQYWYRYYHLFTDLLRHHLQQKQPTIVPLLHLRASTWYEQHDMLVDAVTHAFAAGDLERAANLIERCALSLIERGDDALMSSWLAKLPETIISARPLLCFLSACTFLSTARFEEYERALLLAENAWRAEQNTEMLSRVFDLRAYAALLRRDGSQALAYAQRAITFAPEEEQLIRGNASVTLGTGHFFNGELSQALATLTQGYRLSQKSYHMDTMLHATIRLGDIQVMQGNLHEAVNTFRQLIRGASEKTLWHRMTAHLRLCDIFREWNDLARAIDHWQQAMLLAKRSGQGDFATAAFPLLAARLAWARGEQKQVMAWFDKAEQSLQRFGEYHAYLAQILAYRVQFLLARGDVASASRWSERYTSAEEGWDLSEKDSWELMHARLSIAQGKIQEAVDLLEEMLQAAQAQRRVSSEIAILVLLVLAYHAQGKREQAMQTLECVLARSEPGGYIRVFVDEGAVMGKLFAEYYSQSQRRSSGAQQAFSFEYVHAVLRAFGSEAQPSIWINPQNGEDALIEKLSEREQEVLNLIAAGLSNHEIAQKLVVTVSTIKTHLNNIYAKLHVHTRLQAVTKAYDVGVLRRGEVDTEPLTHSYSPEKMRYRTRTR